MGMDHADVILRECTGAMRFGQGSEGRARPGASRKAPASNRKFAFGETGRVGRCPVVPTGRGV